MFAYEPHINPPFDIWEDGRKPLFISEIISDICSNILKKGDRTEHNDLYDIMYEYIEDRIQKYLPEPEYE